MNRLSLYSLWCGVSKNGLQQSSGNTCVLQQYAELKLEITHLSNLCFAAGQASEFDDIVLRLWCFKPFHPREYAWCNLEAFPSRRLDAFKLSCMMKGFVPNASSQFSIWDLQLEKIKWSNIQLHLQSNYASRPNTHYMTRST
jgi:hypothetical protein